MQLHSAMFHIITGNCALI